MKYLSLKFITLLLVISFLPSFLTQCCGSGCCRGEYISKPFFNTIGATSVSYRVDTTNNTPETYNQQPIYHRNYFCWLRAEVEYYSMQKALPTNFGQSLMACEPSPPLGYKGSEEKIASIQVFSNADYDNTLPAGSNLANIFQIKASIEGYGYSVSSVNQDYKSIATFLATNPNAFYDACLRLSKAPTISKKHTFRIAYRLANGEEYSIQTPEITFQ